MRKICEELPPMPPKSFFRKNFMPGFVDQRQNDLEALIQAMVASDPDLKDAEP